MISASYSFGTELLRSQDVPYAAQALTMLFRLFCLFCACRAGDDRRGGSGGQQGSQLLGCPCKARGGSGEVWGRQLGVVTETRHRCTASRAVSRCIAVFSARAGLYDATCEHDQSQCICGTAVAPKWNAKMEVCWLSGSQSCCRHIHTPHDIMRPRCEHLFLQPRDV